METEKNRLTFAEPVIKSRLPVSGLPEKKHFRGFRQPFVPLPNLVESQLESFRWFLKDGLGEVIKEFSPIKDYSGKKFELEFADLKISEPKFDEYYAKSNKLSYEASIKVTVRLKNLTLKENKEQEVFMADLPLMTKHGTFIISGVERVIVPQLARSFGIFFTSLETRASAILALKSFPPAVSGPRLTPRAMAPFISVLIGGASSRQPPSLEFSAPKRTRRFLIFLRMSRRLFP